MKRLPLLACALLAAACSTAPKSDAPAATNVLQPEIQMIQLVGPADLNYPSGLIEVQFGLRIANNSSEAIRLRQVEMTPVGFGGPYRVRRRAYFFNEEVAANGSKDVTFWARADAEGDAYAGDAHAPVSLRAVAMFETPNGSFRKILTKTFNQRGAGAVEGQ
jgi:hypothetical protein